MAIIVASKEIFQLYDARKSLGNFEPYLNENGEPEVQEFLFNEESKLNFKFQDQETISMKSDYLAISVSDGKGSLCKTKKRSSEKIVFKDFRVIEKKVCCLSRFELIQNT